MKRKSFILFIVAFFILLISTVCFATDDATNDVKNAVNGGTNAVIDGAENLAEDARDVVGTAEDTIENGVSDIGNAIEDGATDVDNAIMDGTNSIEDAGDESYIAARSNTEDVATGNTMNASIWTWVALAIAAIVIVGVVWYYASQNNKK